MLMKRRILALFLALCLTVSLPVNALAADPVEKSVAETSLDSIMLEDMSETDIHDGIIQYGTHEYYIENGRAYCDGEEIIVGTGELVKLALCDDVIYIVTGANEEWIEIDRSLCTGVELFGVADNESEIYNFARNTLGVNSAAACGILANIYAESSFRPTASCIDTNGLTSYGICQWNGGRFTALKNYCSNNGLDYTTLYGQLRYLQYELNGTEKSAFNKIKGVADTAQGAYDAGYNWARYFERCASKYYSGRAVRARDTYWPKWGTVPVGKTSIPSPSVDGQRVTLSWTYSGGADSFDVYLVQAPWGWEDIKYCINTQSTSCTFVNVAPGDYRAFTIARPNADTVQSEWASLSVSATHTHTWSLRIAKEPTFTAYGERYWVCTDCGETTGMDAIPMLNSVTAQYSDNISITYHRSGLLEINGTGEFSVLGNACINFSQSGFRMLDYLDQVTSVRIGEGITSIKGAVFGLMGNLENVNFPNSLTDMSGFDSNGNGYLKLKSVYIPANVTFVGNPFFNCEGLTDIEVSSLNPSFASQDGVLFDKNMHTLLAYPRGRAGAYTVPSNVSVIGSFAFSHCPDLTRISFPSSITEIGNYGFSHCYGLTNISIPEGVIEIGDRAFANCVGLSSITLPKTIQKTGDCVFEQCSGLISATILNGRTDYGSLFEDCTALKEVFLPNDMQKLRGTFRFCTSLTSIFIPESVTEIGDQTFLGCTGLTNITIPGNVARIGYSAFEDCTELTSISIPESVTEIDLCAFEGCTKLTGISIPESVTEIGTSIFKDCTRLTSISIPESVTVISFRAFEGCSALTSITIPSSVREIKHTVFSGTTLKDVYYGGTAEQWASIQIDTTGNEMLSSANIHCQNLPDSGTPLIITERKTARANEAVDVQISLQNNPGITNMQLLVEFDETALTLTNVKDGGMLGSQNHSNNTHSPYTLNWGNDFATSNFMTNGPIVTLTFSVSPQAKAGIYPIRISYDKEEDHILDKDLQPVDFSVVEGSVTVTDILLGDANKDRRVTSIDRIFVSRYLSNWIGYTEGEVDLAAADVNDDGKVTSVDRIILARHLANWSGYESLPYLPNTASVAGLLDSRDSSPAIRVSDAYVQSDGTAAVTISMENNPGIVSLLLHVAFDESVLTLVAVEDTGILGTQAHSNNMQAPYILSWTNDTAESNCTANGEIATLRFHLREGASGGQYPVQISYSLENDECMDKDFNPVFFQTYDGSVYTEQGIRLDNLQVTSNSASVSVVGNPGSGCKLVIAIYGDRDQFLGLYMQDATSAGVYQSPVNVANGRKITAMLVDNSWHPLCENIIVGP